MKQLMRKIKRWWRWNICGCDHYHCPFCDGEMIWDSDFDVEDGEYDCVGTVYHCPECGREYHIYQKEK